MTSQEQALLKVLYMSKTWSAALSLMHDMIGNWQTSSSATKTEWDYMSESLRKDGRIEGFGMFVREIESLCNKK